MFDPLMFVRHIETSSQRQRFAIPQAWAPAPDAAVTGQATHAPGTWPGEQTGPVDLVFLQGPHRGGPWPSAGFGPPTPAAAGPSGKASIQLSLRKTIDALMAEWTLDVGPITHYIMWHALREDIKSTSLSSAICKRLQVMREIYPAEPFPTTWTALLELIDEEHLSPAAADDPLAIARAFERADRRIAALERFYGDYGGKNWSGLLRHHATLRKDRLAAAGLPIEWTSRVFRAGLLRDAQALQDTVPLPSA